MTDELIARLSADLKPVRRMAMARLLIGATILSAIVAVIAMLMLLGMRPDMAAASATMAYWTKFGYSLALAVLGFAATLVLARPDGRIRWPWLAAIALLAGLIVLAVVQLARAEDMMPAAKPARVGLAGAMRRKASRAASRTGRAKMGI